jgi:hypothetical protein
MKDEYKRLMCEVHSLEPDKQALAEDLENARNATTHEGQALVIQLWS